MAGGGGGVTVDTSDLVRGVRQLADGLKRAGPRAAMRTATATASKIRANVPVRSGALRGTVDATSTRDGAEVTYGGGLAYADYIEHRAHAVEDATAGASDDFHAAMVDAAEGEVRRL